jgi:hypothetical protein
MTEQRNLFGEVERKPFHLWANKKNTIFCNEEKNDYVDTPVKLSEYESLLIETKFNEHLENVDYKYLLQTGFYDTPERKRWIDLNADAITKTGAYNETDPDEQAKNLSLIAKYEANWKQVVFDSGQWRIDKGKISNGSEKVSLTNFTNLPLRFIEACFYYNTQYNYFKLFIGNLKIYIVGEFE